MLDNKFNKKRYHFFLGSVFTNPSEYKLINRILHNLRSPRDRRKKIKKLHWNNRFFVNLIYLGYLEENVAKEYMDNIFSVLIKELVLRISVLDCNYTDLKIKSDGSYNKVSINFNDSLNTLQKIIVPYLHKNGILPIYPNKTNILKPTIDVFHYKDDIQIDEDTIEDIQNLLKTESFKLDHISLIKGESIDIRSGTPSIHDRMNIEEVFGYKYDLKSGNKINNASSNASSNNESTKWSLF